MTTINRNTPPINIRCCYNPTWKERQMWFMVQALPGKGPHRVLFFWHYVGNKLITVLSNMVTNLNMTDVETGFKAFKRDLLNKIVLEEDRFGFEIEITIKLARLKCRIYEVGISYWGRDYSEGKKITWKDGIKAIFAS